ncbi:MAG: peptidase [Oscillatoriales cyanobacterium CG2_30_44_21]|nr:MAG: peptidase [Oscillatoriales cyanobacterium CG2_30_44_21]
MTKAPYGSWKSPISSDLIVSSSIRLGAIATDGSDIYWNEGRPTEGGRNVIMRYRNEQDSAQYTEMTPTNLSVRSQVHEYGGGEYLVADGRIYFSNFSDRGIYRQVSDSTPKKLTVTSKLRFADFAWSRDYGKLICICEDHTGAGEPINTLVAVSTTNGEDIQVLATGADFYASPRLNATGDKLAWISWNHPNMPWDGTELWVADLRESNSGVMELQNSQLIAGGMEESIFQPEWSTDGGLYFVSDRNGWWNLYGANFDASTTKITALCPMEAEFGQPQWVFGMTNYGFSGDRQLICTYTQDGQSYLAKLDLANPSQGLKIIDLPFTSISGLHCAGDRAVFTGGSATEPTAIIALDLTKGTWQKLRSASDLQLDPDYISAAQSIEFPTENGKTAYGLFYPPKNKDFSGDDQEKPPLLVKSHGGPTASTSGSLSLGIQYWTSRGFAVLDVNYGGSTGYGRAYRDRLKGNWGIVDVDDCANGAKFLAAKGLVDGDRLAISGGSAGGYTTLCALTFRDDFKAGASHYGICDLEALATDTHKFESRYLDSLIGKYPAQKEIYIQRSPIHFTEKLSCAIAFFQGLEDKVVPPNQAEMMVNALKEKGLPVAYVAFEGEQHGFRKAENIKQALDGEFSFYAQIFGFTPADDVVPIKIY